MKRVEKYYFLMMVMIGPIFFSFGKESRKNEKIKQINVGNFALPGSQQPGPLIGFGQNVIDKGDTQIFAYVDQLKGNPRNFVEVAPSLLYAITDKLSIFLELPIAAHFTIQDLSSHGVEDFLIQLEYAAYKKATSTTINQITLVANMGFPTGSPFKVPPTGFGAVSFFLGFTASHIASDWYYFTSGSATLTTTHNNTKFGDQFLYQWGLSRNIWYKADKWIFNWMIELDGIYKQRNKVLGAIDPDSGGNELILGPSLWLSTQHIILQLGISGVIARHLFGNQPKDLYYLAANIGWKF
jgi:hypothetical protein